MIKGKKKSAVTVYDAANVSGRAKTRPGKNMACNGPLGSHDTVASRVFVAIININGRPINQLAAFR